MRVRVLLAGQHQLIRHHLRRLLEAESDWEVVAEAADGRDAVQLASVHLPDVAVIDQGTPGLHGLEATRRILEQLPAIRVVVYSNWWDEAYVEAAWRAGARGFVAADSADVDLVPAIIDVLQDRLFVSAIVQSR